MQSALMSTGRILLALYFLLPGIAKFASWERHIALMEAHEMLMVPVLLALAGLIQIAGGFCYSSIVMWWFAHWALPRWFYSST